MLRDDLDVPFGNICISTPGSRNYERRCGRTTENARLTSKTLMLEERLSGLQYENGNFCVNAAPGLRYLVYFHSAIENTEKRKMLRQTWANLEWYNGTVEFLFFVGKSKSNWAFYQQSLHEEIKAHGDMVLGDFLDVYRNTTLKALFALNWISNHCGWIRFAIKVDDDTFMNIFKLREILDAIDPSSTTIACSVNGDRTMPILREKATCSKWCVEERLFRGMKFYPRYCSGMFYAISRSLLSRLVTAARTTPPFWIEDVYITGLLTLKIRNVSYVSLNRYMTLKAQDAIDDYGDGTKPLIYLAVHMTGPKLLFMWNELRTRLHVF